LISNAGGEMLDFGETKASLCIGRWKNLRESRDELALQLCKNADLECGLSQEQAKTLSRSHYFSLPLPIRAQLDWVQKKKALVFHWKTWA